MQQSVSIRRPLLVSGRYVLVNIILDISLAYAVRAHDKTAPRANGTQSSIPSHTLLTGPIDGGFGGVLSHRGRARRRLVVFLARKYILHIHTRPTVAWDPPPGAYRARAGSRTILIISEMISVGKGLRPVGLKRWCLRSQCIHGWDGRDNDLREPLTLEVSGHSRIS